MAEVKRIGRGRRYSQADKEKAVALYVLNANYAYVAEQVGAPESTVRGWLQSDEGAQAIADCRAKNREGMDARLTALMQRALDASEKRIAAIEQGEKADLREISTFYGTLYDKRALMRGEATSNVGQSIITQDLTVADARDLLDRIRG